jgi:hypothetical protein
MHKSRFIHEPQLNRSHRVIPIPKGGHDGITAPEGADNINLLTNSMVNQALGVAGSDSGNYIHVAQLPLGLNGNASANVEGLTTLEINQQTTYFITDYETFLAYTITAIRGVVSRLGDTITYTAPASAGPGGFIINGRAVNIPITASFTVNTPVITSPVNNATGLSTSPSFTSNAFGLSGGSDTHEGSDWQIATDSGFSNIVSQVTNSAANKLSYNAAGLNSSTTYYVRVRYKGTAYDYSNWATTVAFTTQAASTVNQPSITSPANGATGVAVSPSFTSTAFVVSSGSDTHEGSDWQIATDAGFTNIVAQTTNSALNKTTYSIAGLTGGVTYYARVRYKGTAYGYSAWSSTVSFTTSSVPTYAVATSTAGVNYNEGSTIQFDITTTNVPNGTTLYWSINGTNVAAGDFTAGGLTGSVVINGDAASVSKTLANDLTVEGAETFVFNVRTGSTSGTIVASTPTITINDTSVNPNTAPVVSNMGVSPTLPNTAPYNVYLCDSLTTTVADTELNALGDFSNLSLNYATDYGTFSGGGPTFIPNVLSGVTISFVTQSVSGQNKYLVKHNGTAIGEYLLTPDELTIIFGTAVSKSVGASVITNTHVRDTIRSINASFSGVPDYNANVSYVNIVLTINDGNTGAQGSGGALNNSYTIRINQAAGKYLNSTCVGDNSNDHYSNGSGGITTQVFVDSTTCGYLGNVVQQAVVLSSGDYLLASETRITRVTAAGVLVDTFGINGYQSFVSDNNQIPNLHKDRNLANHYLVLDTGLIIKRYNGDGDLVDTFPGSGSAQTIEKISTDLASSIVCVGFTDVGVADYTVNIFGKSHADGTNNTTIYPVKTVEGLLITRILISSGSIFLLGRYNDGTDNYIYIQKRSSISTIDTTFGNNGEFTFVAGTATDDGYPHDFCIDTNGDILILGSGSVIQDCIIKVNSDGTLDTGFGDSGKLQIYRDYWSDSFANIKTDGTNRIYVLGNVGNIRRYSSSGAQDTTYGTLSQGGGGPDQYITYSYLINVNSVFIRWNWNLSNCLSVDSSGNTVAPILIDVHRFARNNSSGGIA